MDKAAKTEKRDKEDEKVGGLAFFMSLFALAVIATFNVFLILPLWDAPGLKNFLWYFFGGGIGALIAHYLIKGHMSVFVHEWKHWLIANLAGNKFKGLKIRSKSGHFEYSYKKSAAKYNAFISLAPYWVPIFTFVSLLLGLAAARPHHRIIVLIVGIGSGMDFIMNVRDIAPHQTDLSLLRGGYQIGVIYIICINVALLTILWSWVLHGVGGLQELFQHWWEFLLRIVTATRGVRN